VTVVRGNSITPHTGAAAPTVEHMDDHRAQVREFLATRRARISPDHAGLPAYGGHRRVAGLRREEVALLAGVSVDHYVRMERGNLATHADRARFVYLDPASQDFFADWERAADDPQRDFPAALGRP
jgi:hypothetical protein